MNKLEDDRKPMINPLSRVDREIISALNQLGQDGMADSYRMQAENVALYQDMPFEDRELDLIHGQQDYSRNKSCTALKKRAKLPDTRLIAALECNEGSGLSKLVKEKCDFLVSVPIKGKIDSLNASVAAAIIMFEKNRQDSVN